MAGPRLTAFGGAAVLAVTLAIPGASTAAGGTAPAGAGGTAAGGGRVGQGALSAQVVRDSFGVPTVSAGSLPGMWFGAGWAQAQDRMAQLELTRRAVEGT